MAEDAGPVGRSADRVLPATRAVSWAIAPFLVVAFAASTRGRRTPDDCSPGRSCRR
jgi:hypothetical protein